MEFHLLLILTTLFYANTISATPSIIAMDQKLQGVLEKTLPRFACNLSATDKHKKPVLKGENGNLTAVAIAPSKGSILAADSQNNPDYFFHWMRDAALSADALIQMLNADPGLENSNEIKTFLDDYVLFSEKIQNNGSHYGPGDPRANVDGSVDLIQWSRPQRDGPALQSLTLLRYLNKRTLPEPIRSSLLKILRNNLRYIVKNIEERSFDPWEYSFGYHFYTRLVQLGALRQALRQLPDDNKADWEIAAKRLETLLSKHWSAKHKYYQASLEDLTDWRGDKISIPGDGLNTSDILAVLHAHIDAGRFSFEDVGVLSTAEQLETLFTQLYPINANKTSGPAMGRFKGDDYYGGNPWFITTLAQAEFYYRLGIQKKSEALTQKAEAFLAMAMNAIPANGMIGEQFDMKTGAPISSHDLSWSYSALITTVLSREKRLGARSSQIQFQKIKFKCPQN
jgi:glucoamylase